MTQRTRELAIFIAVLIALGALGAFWVLSRHNETAQGAASGAAYLATNAARPQVTTTASGLQYEVITQGTGRTPTAADTVIVHYTGTLTDGTQFDSSRERGEPASFGVTQVIPGWTEGLQLMPIGSRYIFTIPGDLAYGAGGIPGTIPPNAALVFDVELLGIQ